MNKRVYLFSFKRRSRPTDSILKADISFCLPVFRSEALEDSERFDPELWSREVRDRGGSARAASSRDELQAILMDTCKEGDLVLFMSSGNMSPVINRLIEEIKEKNIKETAT